MLIIFLLPSCVASGQRKTEKAREIPDTPPRDLWQNFTRFYENGAAEKLYIQTDKPYYIAGETPWVKGHLANATTLVPVPSEGDTNYIYVELIDFQNSVVLRNKVKRDSGSGFHHALAFPNDLTPGDYCLRGYTQWMRNEGAEFPSSHLGMGQFVFMARPGKRYYGMIDDSGAPLSKAVILHWR
ncbi:MAG: hypothetical protein LBU80_06635 [Rikenellaceae bacterium]|nr:hypothetical protein [Rikenellaceae bacterium]